MPVPPVATTASQLLTGLQLAPLAAPSQCTACGRSLDQGDQVAVYAYRPADRERWDVPRLYCRGCKQTVRPTVGVHELLATARLGSVHIPSGRKARRCLTGVEVVARSPPGEGRQP